MAFANIGWDLAKFSGGRFILGFGTQVKGHNERHFSVPRMPLGPRLRDMSLAIRAIWDSWQNGTRLNVHSDHCRRHSVRSYESALMVWWIAYS
jgi:alkanesulfonate monooxygenase SsuD/methylene tetrahydromethanopterin reductase-like flavin-dependent oxidoreductase (luciferase family)